MAKLVDLTGKKFGRLTVIERAEDYISPKGQHSTQWLCECSCPKHTKLIVSAQSLKKGVTQSCGCLQKEKQYISHHKTNVYNLKDKENCFLYASNTNNIFYFDYEDYEKIKNYCWTEDKNGYLFSLTTGERINFHRFLIGAGKGYLKATANCLVVDHIDGNPKNNKKENLRICRTQENTWNRKVSQGKSGVIGVSYVKNCNKWNAYIEKDKIMHNLGYFKSKEEAIIARLKAEKELFGEYAGQKELMKQYGI